MLNGTGTNADKRLARTLLGNRGFTPGQIREFVGRDTVETSGGEPATPKTFTSPNPRYAAYVKYARENGQTPMSRTEHEAKYGGPTGPDTLPDDSPIEPDLELEALVERIRAGKIARGENPNENSNDAYNELSDSGASTDNKKHKGFKYRGNEKNSEKPKRQWKFKTDVPSHLDKESNDARLKSWTTKEEVIDPSGDGYWLEGDWYSDIPD